MNEDMVGLYVVAQELKAAAQAQQGAVERAAQVSEQAAEALARETVALLAVRQEVATATSRTGRETVEAMRQDVRAAAEVLVQGAASAAKVMGRKLEWSLLSAVFLGGVLLGVVGTWMVAVRHLDRIEAHQDSIDRATYALWAQTPEGKKKIAEAEAEAKKK